MRRGRVVGGDVIGEEFGEDDFELGEDPEAPHEALQDPEDDAAEQAIRATVMGHAAVALKQLTEWVADPKGNPLRKLRIVESYATATRSFVAGLSIEEDEDEWMGDPDPWGGIAMAPPGVYGNPDLGRRAPRRRRPPRAGVIHGGMPGMPGAAQMEQMMPGIGDLTRMQRIQALAAARKDAIATGDLDVAEAVKAEIDLLLGIGPRAKHDGPTITQPPPVEPEIRCPRSGTQADRVGDDECPECRADVAVVGGIIAEHARMYEDA